ncbi:hypothetical protein GCM10017691_37620 [Pseudonocardia petroleophila]|uniref:SnoaL-like domain-containing protein n=1 Tax=Pseudonocardia petroleophila TaxID=37331 RepID=A0A7G7MCI1_9PSEU|nr:hypothetical protein [Pseudonocardia petroleophila]QNG50492.1 hypothetical protein H6H00_19915 [Pseudonocardia petroleophila]
MQDFRPELTYTSFADHMHKAVTPLQRKHLETVVHHSKGEVLADLSMVLPTLSDDPQYHEFGVFVNTLEDTGPKGLDAVRATYTEMVSNGSYVIESKKTRVVVSDYEIVTEGTFRQILSAEVARKMGLVNSDTPESNHYVLSARTVVFWEFDEQDRAKGEDRYVMGHQLEPLAEEDLPADYPAQFRTKR